VTPKLLEKPANVAVSINDKMRITMKRITVPLLRALREQKGWSQELLAEYSDLSKRTIQRLESGGNTTVESAQSLAATLGLPSYLELCNNACATQGPKKEEQVSGNVEELIAYLKRHPAAARMFWINLIAMSGSFIFAPIWFLGAGSGELGLWGDFVLVIGVLYLSAMGALSWKWAMASQSSAVIFMLGLLWFNSAPTTGWGTLFYTDTQITRFKQLAEMREVMDELQSSIASFSSKSMSVPVLENEPLNPWGGEWSVNKEGYISTALKDENVCHAVNKEVSTAYTSDVVPVCGTPDAAGVVCCLDKT
jgi:transcriptional regulator with XRE-family HTH domain